MAISSKDYDLLVSNMRTARNEKLGKSDIELLKAIEDASSYANWNTSKSAWVTYRTLLRDLPASIPDAVDDDYGNLPEMPLSPTETAADTAAKASQVKQKAAAAALIDGD